MLIENRMQDTKCAIKRVPECVSHKMISVFSVCVHCVALRQTAHVYIYRSISMFCDQMRTHLLRYV